MPATVLTILSLAASSLLATPTTDVPPPSGGETVEVPMAMVECTLRATGTMFPKRVCEVSDDYGEVDDATLDRLAMELDRRTVGCTKVTEC